MESVSETRDPAMRKTAGFLGAGLLLLAFGLGCAATFQASDFKTCS